MMAADPFSFLRATFYRWAELAPQVLPELAEGVRVLAVGDLHVENYGTWRDAAGRLVWGINDFDEACRMPFTFDLVRLATSAGLAAAEGHLNIDLKQSCAAIIAGYTGALRAGGRPMVLAERDRWLRKMASGRLRDPVAFWARMQALPTARGWLPPHLKPLPVQRDEGRLLRAMGWESGNIHLGTRGAGKAILADLKRRKSAWLREAATTMGRLVRDDWKEWRASRS